MVFGQTIKKLKRTREVVRILVKYGFEDLVVNTPLRRLMSIRKRETWSRGDRVVFETTTWERIRMATEELGATFVKGAQVLSNRPDLLPQPLIDEFQKLQSNVPPFSWAEAKEILISELGKPIEEVFLNFEETCIGSASIGQVHRAKLLDGTEVVVKIQRPGVKQLVMTDLGILKSIARRGEAYFEKNGVTNLMDVIEAFEKSMLKEMDYTVEARNIEQFRNFYKDHKEFYVPAVYKQYTTQKIMVLEFVRGCKITDVDQLKTWGQNPEKIAERGLDIYLNQIFEHGFFHADPHPGNILISPEGTIYLIDFGMVGKLNKRDKKAFAGVMISMAQQDARRMSEYMLKLSTEHNVKNTRELESDLGELIDDFALRDVSESSFAELAKRLQAIIYKYRMRVPGAVFIILRALAILEGIGKAIHPTFNTYDFIRPYGKKLILEEFSPENLAFRLFNGISNMASFASAFPVDAKEVLHKLRRGTLRIEIAHKEYEPFVKKLDYMLNKVILVVLIFALLLSGSVLAIAIKTPDGCLPGISTTFFIIAGGLFLLLWRKMTNYKH